MEPKNFEITWAVLQLMPNADFNPNFYRAASIEEARRKMLWRSQEDPPAKSEIDAKIAEFQAEQEVENEKRVKQNARRAQGLTNEAFLELLIRNDTAAIAQFRQRVMDIENGN